MLQGNTHTNPWLSVLATTREGYPLPPTTCSTSTTATYAVRTARFEAGDGVTPSSGAPGGPRLLLLLCFFPCGVCAGSVCATGCENRVHIVRPLLVATRTFTGVPCPICLRMCSGNCFEVVPLWEGVDTQGVRHYCIATLHAHTPCCAPLPNLSCPSMHSFLAKGTLLQLQPSNTNALAQHLTHHRCQHPSTCRWRVSLHLLLWTSGCHPRAVPCQQSHE